MKEKLLRGLQTAGIIILVICLFCLLSIYNEWEKERKADRAEADTVDHATQADMIVNDKDQADSAQNEGKVKEGKVDKVIETDVDGLLVAPSQIS